MKPEEFQKIKSEYNKIMDLMQERTALREKLEAKVDTYINLSILDSRL